MHGVLDKGIMLMVLFFLLGFKVIFDRVTDRSRGFGFVTMETVEEAKEAIRMFNGSVSDFPYLGVEIYI